MYLNAKSRVFVDLAIAALPAEVQQQVISAAISLAENWPAHIAFVGHSTNSLIEFYIAMSLDTPTTDAIFKGKCVGADKPAMIETLWQKR